MYLIYLTFHRCILINLVFLLGGNILGKISKIEALRYKKASKEYHEMKVAFNKAYYEVNSDMSVVINQVDGELGEKIFESYSKLKNDMNEIIQSLQRLSEISMEVSEEEDKL